MRKCCNCKRDILDTEECYRDFDKKVCCKDCYKGSITSLPRHGK